MLKEGQTIKKKLQIDKTQNAWTEGQFTTRKLQIHKISRCVWQEGQTTTKELQTHKISRVFELSRSLDCVHTESYLKGKRVLNYISKQ